MKQLISIIWTTTCVSALLLAGSAAWAGGSGDCNGDGDIDQDDLACVQSLSGTSADQDGYNAEADIDGDGLISGADLSALLGIIKAGG